MASRPIAGGTVAGRRLGRGHGTVAGRRLGRGHGTVAGRRLGRGHGMAATIAVALVIVGVGSLALWQFLGGRVYVMETPSMCPAVCVGSLIVDRPLTGPLRVGELITFHPPGDVEETYTHKIVRVLPGGFARTKGTANSTIDPWVLPRSMLIGKVVFTIWGLGWLVRALPILAVGAASWVLGRSWIGVASRRSWDRAWMTVLVILPIWALRPLVRGAVVGTTPFTHGKAHWEQATVMNTGVLPVKFSVAPGRTAAHVLPGHPASVSAPVHGSLFIREALSLYWWGWGIVALIVVSPLIGYLWHVLRDDEVLAGADDASAAVVRPAERYSPKHFQPRPNRALGWAYAMGAARPG